MDARKLNELREQFSILDQYLSWYQNVDTLTQTKYKDRFNELKARRDVLATEILEATDLLYTSKYENS